MRNKSKAAFFGTAAVIITVAVITVLSYTKIEDNTSIEKELWPLEYHETVEYYSEKFEVPQYVIYATMKAESRFNPKAVSYVGAIGLMQIMPSTYEWLSRSGHLNEEYNPENLTQPDTNIRVGTYYLSWLYSVFSDWKLVSAAYNAGHAAVKKWMENEKYYKNGELIKIPIAETERYVKNVTEYKEKYQTIYNELGWSDFGKP